MESPDELSSDVVRRSARIRLTVGAGVVLVLVAAVVAVLVSLLSPRGVSAEVRPGAGAVRSVAPPVATPDASATPSILVHVVGAVHRPGLYSFVPGQRVVDAVSAAGGFTPKADQSGVNLAQPLSDGEQVVVPGRGGASGPLAPGPSAGGPGSGMVSLNSADLAALQTLDGIGPALAQRILDYRQAHGRFGAVTDLQKVSGIGPKKFAAIKDHVTL